MAQNDKERKIIQDLTNSVKLGKKFHLWMGVLTIALAFCLYHYYLQLRDGLGVTGLGDYVTWGMYIASFVFFVAASLIGMLIGSVLGLLGQEWSKPLSRIAEIVAFAFAAVAGLVIVSDMGRPERLINVFIHGRIQSPILWDVTVVSSYAIISLLLYFLPLIPDIAILKRNSENLPKWQKFIYTKLAFNWKGKPAQQELLKKGMRVLLILVIPVALAIHTVTSWLFAVTPRVGWDSTIFGPYFVSGAFVAGVAGVIILMFILRKIYKIENYITEVHFDKIAKLLVLVSLVYLYFNINEFLVPGYKMQKHDAHHIHHLFTGEYAVMFWFVQIAGLILPIILLLLKPFRKPLPLFLIGVVVLIGSWFKRYLIVVPTMESPFLPIQGVPDKFIFYTPTTSEIAITAGTLIMVVMIVSVLCKIFPVIPIEETIEESNTDL